MLKVKYRLGGIQPSTSKPRVHKMLGVSWLKVEYRLGGKLIFHACVPRMYGENIATSDGGSKLDRHIFRRITLSITACFLFFTCCACVEGLWASSRASLGCCTHSQRSTRRGILYTQHALVLLLVVFVFFVVVRARIFVLPRFPALFLIFFQVCMFVSSFF